MRLIIPVVAMLLSLNAALAKEKCKIVVTVDPDYHPVELALCASNGDVRDKTQYAGIELEDGRFEGEVETECIERYELMDVGELNAAGHTSTIGAFFVEDGATVSLTVGQNGVNVESTGKEFNAWIEGQRQRDALFADEFAALEAKGESATDAERKELYDRYNRWGIDYAAEHPNIGFLLEIDLLLSGYRCWYTHVGSMLDLYHQKFEGLYPGHPVHERISAGESANYEILGRPFNDFKMRTLDGEVVAASDYYAGHPSLIVCWATWCHPCRKEAIEAIPLFEQYRSRGLAAFAIAHEFEKPDDLISAVAQDKYPWPTFYDLDDEFGVFRQLGTSNSAMFLLDASGKIIAVGELSDIEPHLPALFN